MSSTNNRSEIFAAQSTGAESRATEEGTYLPSVLLPTVLAFWRQAGGEYWLTTVGTSMWPLIAENDRLLLRSNLLRLRRGDIIVFLQNGQLIAHRVLKVLDGSHIYFVTKGDNTSYFDSPVSVDDVLGHVVAVQREDCLIVLDCLKWRAIGWFIATATLAVAIPYAWARAVKQHLWGNTPLPGVRLGRKFSATLMAVLLKLLLHFFHHPRTQE